MSDRDLLIERLTSILEALERIPRRFAGIESPSDFRTSEAGIDRMDAICMILIAVGEEFKAIDRKTEGKLLSRYPNVKWQGIMGVRDVLAHGYFQVNTEQLFGICREDIPQLIGTVRQIIQDVKNGFA
ncbi:MAG: HepT-like ribonuclease domain-containing protein [Terriglobia bacterium]